MVVNPTHWYKNNSYMQRIIWVADFCLRRFSVKQQNMGLCCKRKGDPTMYFKICAIRALMASIIYKQAICFLHFSVFIFNTYALLHIIICIEKLASRITQSAYLKYKVVQLFCDLAVFLCKVRLLLFFFYKFCWCEGMRTDQQVDWCIREGREWL